MSCNTFPDSIIKGDSIVKEELVIADDGYHLSITYNRSDKNDLFFDNHQYKNLIKSEALLDKKITTADATVTWMDIDSTKKRKLDSINYDNDLKNFLPRIKKIKLEKQSVYDDDDLNVEDVKKQKFIIDYNECLDKDDQVLRKITNVKKYIIPNCSNCKKKYKFHNRYIPKECLDCNIKLQYECTQCHKQFKRFNPTAQIHLKSVCLRSLNPRVLLCKVDGFMNLTMESRKRTR